MSLLGFLFVVTLVTSIGVLVALAFARAVLYQNVLVELDVTRSSRHASRSAFGGRSGPSPARSPFQRPREFIEPVLPTVVRARATPERRRTALA